MQFRNTNYETGGKKKIIIISISIVFAAIVLFFLFKPGEIREQEIPLEKKIAQITLKKNNFVKQDFTIPQLIKVVNPLIVSIKTFDKDDNPLGQGSGFFINNSGHIVSNLHVFFGAARAKIKTKFGVYEVKKYLAFDEDSDIILFKTFFRGPVLRREKIKTSKSTPQVGEKIVSIGNPLGLELSASDGIVSAIRKKKPFGTVIQITSPISPGSSGSPVLNMKGEIVGIATFQMRQGQNLNFAIPISKALKLKPREQVLLSKMDSTGSSMFKSMNSPMEQGEFLIKQNDYSSAIPYFKEAVQNNPMNAKAYFYLGICYRKTSSQNSISEFKQAIDIDPNLKDVYYEMGLSYMAMNMLDDGLNSLNTEIEKNPLHFKALQSLASIYILKKMYKKARSILETAVEIDETVELYHLLGATYFALSENMDAINAYERAIDMDKSNLISYIGIINVLIKVENWSLGIRYINQGLLEKQDSLELHFLKGILSLGNDNITSAKIELDILKQLKGKEVYKYQNKLRSAISQYERYKILKYQ